ncbi:hypothetical protein GG681_08505 [Epibacterium sp. SM1969]|uniref:PPM-type phosphatase domain-containing protein n=1 Tax=Tritonibacter aquimaris TaxID=2663379 RepID=A0A844APL6_9RHOB|nr:protein phosphatase 2C domain-containing protein [Tritonibacter aquimaris]MQY42683.1 hypothetical protein [Tritonibacter aquimaris]
MYFEILQSISLNGQVSRPNDDRLGATPRRAWVVDGATDLGEPGLLGNQGGASWLSSTASLGFAMSQATDVRRACSDMFAYVSQRFEAERTRDVSARWELPKAAFAVAELGAQQLEVAWAADCPVLLCRTGDMRWCTGTPDTSREKEDAAALGIGDGAAVALTGNILQDRRAQRMQIDHEALSPDPEAAAKTTRYATFDVQIGDELLIMSDGFCALVSDYNRYDASSLWAEIKTRGLTGLAQELREIERKDAECRNFPRFKVSDDATAIWLKICG